MRGCAYVLVHVPGMGPVGFNLTEEIKRSQAQEEKNKNKTQTLACVRHRMTNNTNENVRYLYN